MERFLIMVSDNSAENEFNNLGAELLVPAPNINYKDGESASELSKITLDYTQQAITDSINAGASRLAITAVPTETLNSGYFQILSAQWKFLVDYTKSNDTPSQIAIIAPDQDVANYYMMVYNYWHAADKADRIMSSDWD